MESDLGGWSHEQGVAGCRWGAVAVKEEFRDLGSSGPTAALTVADQNHLYGLNASLLRRGISADRAAHERKL
jgi:hypothetical protein